MEIRWHGNLCFSFKEGETVVIINPDKEVTLKEATCVLTALPEEKRAEISAERVFDWPGEYEFRGVPIVALAAHTKEAGEEDAESTLIFYFEIAGVRFCHVGELGHALTSDMIQSIGDIDVLMINGDHDSPLGFKQSEELIEAIEPRAIAFMGTEEPPPLFAQLGGEGVEVQKKITLKSSSALPLDRREYFLFERT